MSVKIVAAGVSSLLSLALGVACAWPAIRAWWESR